MQETLFKLADPETNFSSVHVKDFIVKPVSIQQVRNFVESWHYSKNINGLRVSHVFGLYHHNDLVGSISMAHCLWLTHGKSTAIEKTR